MKPTMGRIVIFTEATSGGQISPAIIQNVAADGSVRLFVFGSKYQHVVEGITQGDGPGKWNWPPRAE